MEHLKRVQDQQIADYSIEVIRELRDVRPAHYLFKIKNFSSLVSNAEIDKYESTDFEVSGYKWKLSVHPKGNEEVNESNHISLYLVLSESNAFTFHQELSVCFKLFVYNQILDKYLTIQDAKGRIRRFRGTKTEFGFDQLLPLSFFNDSSNGYLVNNCCIFGAEVFVVEPISKGECASIVNDLSNNTYTWNVPNFADLKQESLKSTLFIIGGYKWSLDLHPNGNSKEKGKGLSLFLHLEDLEALNPGRALYVKFVLLVKDQLSQNHHALSTSHRFSASADNWGFHELIPLKKLNDASEGYLANGGITLDVKISFISKVEEFA